jgi:hypothetical protein
MILEQRDPQRPSPPSRPVPVSRAASPEDATVRDARDAYLAENGFTVAAYDDPWTQASFFALDFAVPNTQKHRWAIMLHDLHHVATGFGTDLPGEAEISAWELRGGLRRLGPYVSGIVLSGFLMGFLVAPRRTVRAWRAASHARSLWTLDVPYEQLIAMSVAELRGLVGAPRDGVPGARATAGRHKNAPRLDPATA